MTLIAISAAYGAGGSRVGRELAERLGVPFVDRGIPVAVAERLDVPLEEAIEQEDEPAAGRSLLERLLAGFAIAESVLPAPTAPELVTAEDFHRASQEVIREHAATGRGVILGRGAVVALRDVRTALRVRLSGRAEARIRMAMALGGVDEDTARAAQRRLDGAHAEYVRRFYAVEINDPSLYHLVLDVPTLGVETTVEIASLAARTVSASG